jgi:transcriptional regulator GlxA family with amidase domain
LVCSGFSLPGDPGFFPLSGDIPSIFTETRQIQSGHDQRCDPQEEGFVDPRVRHLTSYLLANSEKHVCLHDIARRVNLSDSQLAHLFRRDTGFSPKRFLKITRLKRARQLLETTFLSVKQIMAQVGCNDPSHFVREFEKMFGESPRNYRKRHLKLLATRHNGQ